MFLLCLKFGCVNYLRSGCLCNVAFAMATPGLLDIVTQEFQFQFYFLLINNDKRGFLITNQNTLKHIAVTDVVAIDAIKIPNIISASKK